MHYIGVSEEAIILMNFSSQRIFHLCSKKKENINEL